jgi:hypothetical protein
MMISSQDVQPIKIETASEPSRIVDHDILLDDGSDASDLDDSTEYDNADPAGNDNNGETSYGKAAEEIKHSVKNQDRGIFWWRIVVKFIMVVSATVLTVSTYVQLSRSEETEFQKVVSLRSKSL